MRKVIEYLFVGKDGKPDYERCVLSAPNEYDLRVEEALLDAHYKASYGSFTKEDVTDEHLCI